MIIKLNYIVRSVHVDLDLMLLELLEFVLIEVVGERALCAAKMATEDEELVLASLMQEAAVDRRFLTHRVRSINCDPLDGVSLRGLLGQPKSAILFLNFILQ